MPEDIGDMWGFYLDVRKAGETADTRIYHRPYKEARDAFLAAVADQCTTSATLFSLATDPTTKAGGSPTMMCTYESNYAELLASVAKAPH